jgi:hypothetical protein
VYCEPAFNEELVPSEYKGAIGLSCKSIAEWKEVFRAYAEQSTGNFGTKTLDGPKSIALKTPKKKQGQMSRTLSLTSLSRAN